MRRRENECGQPVMGGGSSVAGGYMVVDKEIKQYDE